MSRTVSIYIESDAATPAPIEGVEARVYARVDTEFTDALAVATTASDGVAAVVLELGDYTAVVHKYRWEFDRLEFTVEDIDGQIYDVVGNEYGPPTPPEPATCEVYGYLRDPSGEAMMEPTVTVSLWADKDTMYVGEGITVTDTPVEVEVNDDGSWSVPLVPNASLTPSGSKYQFEITWREPNVDNPRIYEWKPKIIVPIAESAEFGTLVEG